MQDEYDDIPDTETTNNDNDLFIVSNDKVISNEEYSQQGNIDKLLYQTHAEHLHEWDRNLDDTSFESIDRVDPNKKIVILQPIVP